ncbi:MAG: 30S ribosomal protein S6 [Acidobacteria bacterium]|nr:30S ribosomal protein S6 [Acidobacteriota bacterium]
MPNLYETLLIVTPEADDEGVNAVIGDLRATIESDGGTVLQAGVWGRRKLAYMVKGKTEGIYVLIYADGERTLPAALKDRMKLDESVIRSMVVRLEDLQETEARQQIAEVDHAGDAADIEVQRVAAERRHEAEAVAATMSLDEIVAAEEAEAEVVAEAADSDEGEPDDDAEAAGGDDEAPVDDAAPAEDAAPVDESADDAPAEDAAPVDEGDDEAPAVDSADGAGDADDSDDKEKES